MALVPLAPIPFEAKLSLLFLGGVVGAYLVWGGDLATFKDNRLVLGFLVFVVMLCALYGLVVHFKCPERVLWTERYEVYPGRLMSTYICPNHFAHLMQMVMPFCVALLFIPQAGIFLKLLGAYSFAVFLPTIFLTESRAGWLGSIAAVGVVACLMALRRSKALFLSFVILVPLCSTLLLFAGWRYSETFQRRMEPVVEFLKGQSEAGVGSESKDFRPQTWMDTIDMVKDSPFFGHGPGGYRYTYEEYRKRFKGQQIVTGHPHNEYLELMANFGLVGFGLFAVAWLYGLGWVLVKSLKAEETRHAFLGFAFLGTAAGTMVHSFFDFEMHVYPNAMVFALLAALAVGPLREAQRRKSKGRTPERHARLSDAINVDDTGGRAANRHSAWLAKASLWVVACGFLLATLVCAQVAASSILRALGDHAVAARQVADADRHYRLALRIDPQNWRAAKGMAQHLFEQRYRSLDRDEKVRLAQDERIWFERALAQNPKDPEILYGLGKALIFLGRQELRAATAPNSNPQMENDLVSAGLDGLREACRHRRFNDVYWWNLGVELRKAGRYDEALEAFRQAASVRRTASITRNIAWLEAKIRMEESPKGTAVAPPGAGAPVPPEFEPADAGSSGDRGLAELFELMEK